MGIDEITGLERRLYELTHILNVIGREYSLLLEHSDDSNTTILIENAISELKSAENSVANLFNGIVNNRDSIASQWYINHDHTNSLNQKVRDLENSLNGLIIGNDKFVSEVSNCKE